MRLIKLEFIMTAALAFALGACDSPEPEATSSADEGRGPVGKADLVGSCVDACGGQSGGNCWCDDSCAEFGDCCEDIADVCGGSASACEGDNPAGCAAGECGDGEVCSMETDSCVPSACDCDESSGQWQCTSDCSGGVCIPDEAMCEGENPAGCTSNGCDDGEVCVTDTSACVPSACGCDAETGLWLCTSDCGGGVCGPETETPSCEGENPAGCLTQGCGAGEVCSTSVDACIPSACSCDGGGSWLCTSDCGGGSCVPADTMSACPGDNPAESCIDDDACIPSACGCDEVLGIWQCTSDCGGGVQC